MRQCKVCGKDINQLNGNARYCKKCTHVVVPKKYVTMVTVPLDEFLRYKEAYDDMEDNRH